MIQPTEDGFFADPSSRMLNAIYFSSDDEEYFELIREYERHSLEEAQTERTADAGADDDYLRLLQARVLFLDECERGGFISFPRSSADFSAVSSAAYWLGNVPSFVWMLIPLALSVCVVAECRSESILSHAPFSRLGRTLFFSRFLLVASLSVVVVTLLPSTILSACRNGLGDFGYPIVFWQFGELRHMTCGEAVALYLAGYMLFGLMYGLLLDLSATLRSAAPLIVTYLCHFIPVFIFGPTAVSLPSVAACIPPVYFSVPHLVGYISYTSARDQLPILGGSSPTCVACILLVGLAVLLLSSAIQRIQCKRCFSPLPSAALGRHGLPASRGLPGQALFASGIELRDENGACLLSNARFGLARNEVVGLLAPNGAGKTTLLRLLSGEPSLRGRAALFLCIDEILLSPLDQRDFRKNVCYLPSDGRFAPGYLRSCEAIELAMLLWEDHPRGRDVRSRAGEPVSQMGIERFQRKKVQLLSAGMRQQLCISMALATSAAVLLLDEPMNSLDPRVVESDVSVLRQWSAGGECRAIALSSHLLQTLDALCPRLCCLTEDKGIVASSTRAGRGASEIFWETYSSRR